jgi:hypothetical protein
MAERVAGIGAWDAEDEQALVSAISYDDPRVARVPIPLERDHETSVLACVEFHKHDWLLPGFGHLIRKDGKRLMAPTVRFLVRDRARVIAGSATGIDRWYTGSRRGDPTGARHVRTPAR